MNNTNTKLYEVIEGDSGVLYLTDQFGEEEIFQPNYDLDEARKMLFNFYHLETSKNKLVKDSFVLNDRDWFPNAVGQLYWQFFVPMVKYKVLLDKYIADEISFSNITSVSNKESYFSNLISIIRKPKENKIRSFNKVLYNKLINFRNLLIVRKKGDLIIYKYLIDDFRLKDLIDDLSKDFSMLTVSWVSKKNILKYIFNRNVFFYTYPLKSNKKNIHIVNNSSVYFDIAFTLVHSTIKSQRMVLKNIQPTFNKLNYKLFLGLDDANVVYPLIYASKLNGLRTIGIQHGFYGLRQEQNFMNFIDSYDWFDNVIVWGKYWQDIILRNSKLFSKDFHLIGCKKLPFDFVENNTNTSSNTNTNTNNKSILIPYEFLSDTIKMGTYIKKLMDFDFQIYFKIRPDKNINIQIQTLNLNEYETRLKIVENITPALMEKIDIVAGSMSTLIYDLLLFNKPTWIFSDVYNFLDDMVDNNLARLISDEDMLDIENIYLQEMKNQSKINLGYLFDEKYMGDTIRNIIYSNDKQSRKKS